MIAQQSGTFLGPASAFDLMGRVESLGGVPQVSEILQDEGMTESKPFASFVSQVSQKRRDLGHPSAGHPTDFEEALH